MSALKPGNAQVRMILVLVITAVVALATVVNMMQGDYTNLFIGLTVAGVMLYIGTLWRFSWLGAILVGLLGFSIMPTSFQIPADLMCCGLALGMTTTVLMRRALGAPSPEALVTPGLSAGPMVAMLVIYVSYLSLQGMYGEISPVYAGQYSLKNTIKGYAEDVMPPVTLVLLVILRYRLPSMDTLGRWVTPVMVIAILSLSIYRVYQISQGVFDADVTSPGMGILIPGINLIPGEFSLRVAAPIAVLWASSRIFTRYEGISRREWLMNGLLILLALVAAILSTGRAVPALCLLGICAMAFMSRRHGFLLVTIAAFILFIVGVNLAGPFIDDLPYSIRRSVAVLRFGGSDDKDAIAGSTTMRQFLVTEGMKEVRSNPRILATGRGVLEFTLADARINASDAEYDKWMLAVRTGRLHRTSANQLIRYGAVGAILYYMAQFAIILYCWKAYRSFKRRALPETSLAAFVLALLVMNTFTGLVADNQLTNFTVWFVALLVGVAVKQGVTRESLSWTATPLSRRVASAPGNVVGQQG